MYDLVVTGGGIGHAANALRDETGADPCVAVVLFAYNELGKPITGGQSIPPIRIESLGWYEQERAQIQTAASRARKEFGGASNAEGAKEGAFSVGASFASSATEEKMPGKHSNGANRNRRRLTSLQMLWRAKKGQKIYQGLRPQLERDHNGEYVAIDLSNSKCVTASRFEEAARLASESFGDHPTWITRIGGPMTATVAA